MVMAHWSIWISGLIVAMSNFLDITPWPQTRKSTPACFMLWIKAMLGLSWPSLRALKAALFRAISVPS